MATGSQLFKQERAARGGAYLDMSPKDLSAWSLSRAVLGAANGNLSGIEAEASRTIAQQLGTLTRNQHCFFIPADVLLSRDMTAAGVSGSNYLVQHQQPLSFMDTVRARSVLMRMGATMLENLTGTAAVPKTTADPAAYWLTNESTTITEGQPTVGLTSLTSKHVGAYTEVSRLLSLQAPAVDSLLMTSLAGSIAVALDAAAIAGTGASGQPTGIINTASVGTFTGTSLAWAGLIESQADVVGGAEVDLAQCGYVTTAAVAQVLMARQRFTGSDAVLWQGAFGDGIMAGTRAIATASAPTGTLVFGHWPSLVIGLWSGLQVEINPYAGFQTGLLGMRALLACDVGVRRAADFSVATSVT